MLDTERRHRLPLSAMGGKYFEVNGLDIEPVAIDPTASFFQKPGAGYSGLPVAGHYSGYSGAVA